MIFARKVMIQRSVLMAKVIRKLIEKRNLRRNKMRSKRSPPDIPWDPNPNYWLSPWGQLVTKFASVAGGPSIGSREGKLFRRRFRVPYDVFCKLVTMCLDKKLFGLKSHKATNIANRNVCPVEIKLLAVLRILGRNWNFDDIAEATLSTCRYHVYLKCYHVWFENTRDKLIYRVCSERKR